MDTPDLLREKLKEWFGHDDFRAGQRPIVEAVLAGQDTLAILPTGGGKSLTFQFPAMLLPGMTLVLSPLIALMKDQVESLPEAVAAKTVVIHSGLEPSETLQRLDRIRSGEVKMVYVAPERLRQASFVFALQQAGVSLLVIDEAHCISQWGHEFRPDYRTVGRIVELLAPRTVLALTATATPDIADDIVRQLGREMRRVTRPTFRDNLHLSCLKVQGEEEKQHTVLRIAQNTEGPGLIYCGSREKCEQTARMLARYGIAAGFYHAGLPSAERSLVQERFKRGELRVMAATVAFGMGVDKTDIRFVVHYHPSRTLENYYQEAGRAGRDGSPSRCAILYSSSDLASAKRHLREDSISVEAVRDVYGAIRRLLNGKRIGTVDPAALVRESGVEEEQVRLLLPLLEEVQLIRRHTDICRAFGVFPDFTAEDGEAPDHWERLRDAIGGGGQFAPVELAEAAEIPVTELETVLLTLRKAGLVRLQFSGRDYLLEQLPTPPGAKKILEDLLADRVESAETRWQAMSGYLTENQCRHARIARFFGDRWTTKNCGQCDYCTGERPDIVSSAEAPTETIPEEDVPLVVLRLVADLTGGRSPFAVGKTGLVKILRGLPAAPVKPQRTRWFGSLSDRKNADVERILTALVEESFLEKQDDDTYQRLHLTAQGREALRTETVTLRTKLRKTTPSDSISLTPKEGDGELLAVLKQWRRGTAQAENVPPYVVFSDATLQEIATFRPGDEEEMLTVRGVGKGKVQKYGAAVLQLLAEHAENDPEVAT